MFEMIHSLELPLLLIGFKAQCKALLLICKYASIARIDFDTADGTAVTLMWSAGSKKNHAIRSPTCDTTICTPFCR